MRQVLPGVQAGDVAILLRGSRTGAAADAAAAASARALREAVAAGATPVLVETMDAAPHGGGEGECEEKGGEAAVAWAVHARIVLPRGTDARASLARQEMAVKWVLNVRGHDSCARAGVWSHSARYARAELPRARP